MNYLQLVQRLRQECGVSGAAPATTLNQVGEIARLCAWINAAWMDVQLTHNDWFFLRQPFAFNTVAGKQAYTPSDAGLASFSNWKRDSLRLYSQALGVGNEMILPYVGYDTLRDLYMFGQMRTTTQRPVMFSIDPQKKLVLGATPDLVYVVNGEYYALPSDMALDADTPAMPAQYHMAIVYRAMTHYGEFEAAPEVYQHGDSEFKKMLARLELDQLPTMTFGAPLA
jgi:hypothetical protein